MPRPGATSAQARLVAIKQKAQDMRKSKGDSKLASVSYTEGSRVLALYKPGTEEEEWCPGSIERVTPQNPDHPNDHSNPNPNPRTRSNSLLTQTLSPMP